MSHHAGTVQHRIAHGAVDVHAEKRASLRQALASIFALRTIPIADIPWGKLGQSVSVPTLLVWWSCLNRPPG